jgi:maltose O-acetyltransferase
MCTKGPLEIGANCWFGTRVTVLDSTATIGEHCVFAAGTVVTKPTEPDGLYIGAPAKRVKTISVNK